MRASAARARWSTPSPRLRSLRHRPLAQLAPPSPNLQPLPMPSTAQCVAATTAFATLKPPRHRLGRTLPAPPACARNVHARCRCQQALSRSRPLPTGPCPGSPRADAPPHALAARSAPPPAPPPAPAGVPPNAPQAARPTARYATSPGLLRRRPAPPARSPGLLRRLPAARPPTSAAAAACDACFQLTDGYRTRTAGKLRPSRSCTSTSTRSCPAGVPPTEEKPCPYCRRGRHGPRRDAGSLQYSPQAAAVQLSARHST